MPNQSSYSVIVYGGDIQAVFAAAKASAELGATASNHKVLLIVPYPQTTYKGTDGLWHTDSLLGGIMTAGGLNYWDDVSDNSGNLYTKGSYYYYKNHMGPGFNRIALSDYCKYTMSDRFVDVLYSYDICNYTHANNPRRITSVTVSPITRDADGRIIWQNLSNTSTYNCNVLIDASTDGRVARVENTACTVGRYDWPTAYLPSDEVAATDYVGRQQAATLMVKMRLPNPPTTQIVKYPGTNIAAALWSEIPPYKQVGGAIYNFNQAHKNADQIMIKPCNAARDGQNSDEWWVNGILVFNVDGRAHYRDIAANNIFKVTPKYNYRTTDAAWIATKSFIKNHIAEIQNAFQTFPGFSGCEIVLDNNNDPVVGDLLYIRESVHMSKVSTARAHNTESNYHITRDEARTPGTSPTTGSDTGNYAHRIGVGKYWCDIHPFQPSDLISANGNYLWGEESAQRMRSDAFNPTNPVYIPYEAITTDYVANLLIPGYAANISSYAWGELRVFSHLSVLGDAAGIVAAYCCNHNVWPYDFMYYAPHVQAIQNRILAYNGRLAK